MTHIFLIPETHKKCFVNNCFVTFSYSVICRFVIKKKKEHTPFHLSSGFDENITRSSYELVGRLGSPKGLLIGLTYIRHSINVNRLNERIVYDT